MDPPVKWPKHLEDNPLQYLTSNLQAGKDPGGLLNYFDSHGSIGHVAAEAYRQYRVPQGAQDQDLFHQSQCAARLIWYIYSMGTDEERYSKWTVLATVLGLVNKKQRSLLDFDTIRNSLELPINGSALKPETEAALMMDLDEEGSYSVSPLMVVHEVSGSTFVTKRFPIARGLMRRKLLLTTTRNGEMGGLRRAMENAQIVEYAPMMYCSKRNGRVATEQADGGLFVVQIPGTDWDNLCKLAEQVHRKRVRTQKVAVFGVDVKTRRFVISRTALTLYTGSRLQDTIDQWQDREVENSRKLVLEKFLTEQLKDVPRLNLK